MTDLLKKISDLTAGTPAETDVVPYVDLATNTTKKALKSELKGVKGDDGTAATVDVGTTTTVATTVPASVANSGTTSAAIFDFTIPKGETGTTGPAGADGLSCVWEGAWITSTAYQLQDIVSYLGSSYVCVTAHTSGTFATDLSAGKWELACESGLDINWRGAYDNGTAYAVNDAVSYNGSSYICIDVTTGNLPTNDTYWNLMALKGTDGTGSGDVVGPATNSDSYIPQWDGANSKTLKNGIPTSTFAPALGTDDNYVTDAEKIVIGNTSGTNTGDQTLPTKDSLGLDTDDSPQFAGVNVGHASDTTIARSSAGVISVEGVVIPSISSTNTLTNKRITKRVASTTDDATAVIDCDAYDEYYLTAIANNTEISITGTPTSGQTIFIGLKDAGTTKTLTWTGITGLGQTLPVATTGGKQHIVGLKYIASAWRAIAVGVEA